LNFRESVTVTIVETIRASVVTLILYLPTPVPARLRAAWLLSLFIFIEASFVDLTPSSYARTALTVLVEGNGCPKLLSNLRLISCLPSFALTEVGPSTTRTGTSDKA